MGAILLDGQAVANRLNSEVAERVAQLATEGIHVGLGTVLVGDDLPSQRYVAMKHEDSAALGIYSAGEHLPATATQAEVLDVIGRFNRDPKISAFLVQLPLPAGLDETEALLAVDPAKDVDGLLVLADAGVTAVVQPGGSVKDADVIAAADEAGLAMVLTGERHFRH